MNVISKVFSTLQWVGNHPLKDRPKYRAALKFAVSQVAARAVPGDICVAFPNETSLLIGPRMKGAAHFIYPGLTEVDTMSFVMHFLRPGELFVDAGAYVGAYSVLAGGVAKAKVLAFEPTPGTFYYLERNLRMNNLMGAAEPVNAALGAEEGTLAFTSGLGTENHICLEATSEPTVKVRVTTLDAMLQGKSPVLLKVDVEGYETQLFAGAWQALANPSLQAIIVERTGNAQRYGTSEDELHAKIRKLGFEPCAYFPEGRKVARLAPEDVGNIIYVRDFSLAEQRTREAAPYRFGKHVV